MCVGIFYFPSKRQSNTNNLQKACLFAKFCHVGEVKLIRSINQEYASFLDYTKHWVENCNRGGLVQCTDEFYIFIRNVKNSAWTIFNTAFMVKYCGENIKSILLEKFQSNGFTQNAWDNLTRQFQTVQVLPGYIICSLLVI